MGDNDKKKSCYWTTSIIYCYYHTINIFVSTLYLFTMKKYRFWDIVIAINCTLGQKIHVADKKNKCPIALKIYIYKYKYLCCCYLNKHLFIFCVSFIHVRNLPRTWYSEFLTNVSSHFYWFVILITLLRIFLQLFSNIKSLVSLSLIS